MLLLRYILCLLLILNCSACLNAPSASVSVAQLPAYLDSSGRTVAVTSVELETGDHLLALTPEILDYFDPLMSKFMQDQQRARLLHTMLLSPAFLNIDYQGSQTVTAERAFFQQSANCIGYANLYIALARHYGLEARYQLLRKYPQWSREGDRVMMAIHVNTRLQLRHGVVLHVDIAAAADWSRSKQLGRSGIISDNTAAALFYNNLSLEALEQQDKVLAYQMMVNAIHLDPTQALLWSNMGALYRSNQQVNEAEAVYKIALGLDSDSYTALNNLAVLYQQLGRTQDYQHYLQKTNALRQGNPYYYFYLAQVAQDNGNYRQAIKNVQRAIKIKDDEPDFYEFLDVLNRQLELLSISVLSSAHTFSGENDAMQADIASSLPSRLQRRP